MEFKIFGSPSMIRLGLCSGTCITRDMQGVIAAAVAARLDAVEWAADLHVGAGDIKAAEEAMIATLMAGLTTASYATLYQAGGEDEGRARFDALLQTAAALQAPNMRIYAYAEHQALSETERMKALASELRRLGDRAAQKGVTLCLSMGRGTYLDRYDRAQSLVEATGHNFVRLAWEDLPGARAEGATAALEGVGRLAELLVARCAGRDGSAHRISAEARRLERSRLARLQARRERPQDGELRLPGRHAGGREGGSGVPGGGRRRLARARRRDRA
jgi:hydroxypyruvate isomerase